MGKVLSFQNLEEELKDISKPATGCLVDTQLLIASIYEPHTFHEDATAVISLLDKYEIPIFATVTTRTEFVDIVRRIIITEALMSINSEAKTGLWQLTKDVTRVLKTQKLWIDTQASNEDLPILPDTRIKKCKETFFPIRQSGKSGWTEICEYYLGNKILQTWNELCNDLGINYLNLRKGDMDEYLASNLDWDNMYSIMEDSCLSSGDSMITNVLFSSVFPFAITADYDMAYAVAISKKSKDVFIPDSLYNRKFKGKKFK